MDILELIKSRRSVRKFDPEKAIGEEIINKAIEAACWAPSGMNTQPWAFAVIKTPGVKEAISGLTHSSSIIKSAPVLIAVFLDNTKTYDRTKDCQAIGACIQSMLLYIHSVGLGAVWLGEILRNKDKVAEAINAPAQMELMAVVAMGYPQGSAGKGKRRDVGESVFYKG